LSLQTSDFLIQLFEILNSKVINLDYYSRVAFFPLTMGNHVFVGERAVVNAALVGSYVYIGKNAIIVCIMIFIYQVEYKHTINRTCVTTGQAIRPKGLLLYRGWRGRATRNYCAILYSVCWQSSDVHRRITRMHAGSHDRLHEELLWTLLTSARLILVYLYMYADNL